MFPVDRLLLLASILILIGIASSKFSSRIGLPVLVLFLIVGILASDQGIGGIAFDNYVIAHGIGTIALAIILFDGGLRTSMRSFKAVFAPAGTLATLGVLLTSVITGAAASYLLELPLLHGMLVGAIIGSTDAAAVFAVLRGKGVNLRKRVAATLEVESASNDPMAVFLTVGLLEIMMGQMTWGWDLLGFLLMQMVIGAGVGVLTGRAAVLAINRVDLDAAGLYPILTAAAGLLAYALAATIGGSGYLSVYLAGLVIGNRRIVFQKGILLFHDGAAWLAQISMFVLLGLLVSLDELLSVTWEGLAVAAVLILVARPVTVALLLPWFRYNLREMAFISWVGLKGAVPIVLATYPLMAGIENANLLFHVVFFSVLVSAVLQGWTMPLLARYLKLQVDTAPPAAVSLEITSLKDVDGDIVEYTVKEGSLCAHRHVRELRLPDGAVVAMMVRDGQIIPPRGSTRVEPGDHVFLVMRPGLRILVDRVFAQRKDALPIPVETEFPLRGETTVAELEEFYSVKLPGPADSTLHDVLQRHFGSRRLYPGQRLELDSLALVVRTMDNAHVEQVGLVIYADPEPTESEVATDSHTQAG